MMRVQILLLFFLISCSFKSIVIPNITYLMADRVGSKLDFYYSQEKEFKKGLDQLIKAEIDHIKKFNEHLKKIDITNYDLHANQEVYAQIYQLLVLKGNQLFAKVFSEFNKDQIKNFWEKNKDQNETIKNRWKKDKSQEIIKRFNFFFDDLTKQQITLIKNNIFLFQNINKQRYINRINTQRKMKQYFLLKDRKKKENVFNKLFEMNYQEGEKMSNLAPIMKFTNGFFKTLSPKQIKYFKERQQQVTEWITALIIYYKNKKIVN